MASKDLPIVVRGAREHNLQNVDLTLPRNKLICFTGVSGSGKSSMAFDTLYAEGQRRYLESLSSYARQFVGRFPKPDVDYLSGLSPSISISQKATGNNPRSTVGTITELNDFLRVLYARVGTAFCPDCEIVISNQSRDQMVERMLALENKGPYMFLAPVIRGQRGEHRDLFEDLRRQGFNRARIDGAVYYLSNPPRLERLLKHHIDVVVDRMSISERGRSRIVEAVDKALKIGEGTLFLAPLTPIQVGNNLASSNSDSQSRTKKSTRATKKKVIQDPFAEPIPTRPASNDPEEVSDSNQIYLDSDADVDGLGTQEFEQESAPENDIIFSSSYACPSCGISYTSPSPQLLSFNSPQGACPSCEGLGEAYNYDLDLLVSNPDKSLRNGAIELIGKSTEMTRWYRRSITLFAAQLESHLDLEKGYLLKTPWRKLADHHQEALLFGHAGIAVKAKGRAVHGQSFRGIIPELLDTYRATKNPFIQAKHEAFMGVGECPTCRGSRLNPQANAIRLKTESPDFQGREWLSMGDVSKLSILEACEFFRQLELTPVQWKIGEEAIKEVRARLDFLVDVGLEYLSLSRKAPTLSGGESQRIRLATQIGSGLVGVLYVLDEPSIGLHPRDNDRLLGSLKRLRNLGNTLIVVEHDEDTMRIADTIVDFGPGPGVRGGKLITAGSLEEIAASPDSLTGAFLSRTRTIQCPEERRKGNGKSIKVIGATHHNLKDIDVEIPLGCFVAITGVSGSGKSSLITEILSPAIRGKFQRGVVEPGAHRSLEGIENIDKVIDIDQSPIGRTPRSNPATYVKLFDEIRDLFAELPEAKRRGFTPGTFSFNTENGRCSACDGHGAVRLDMEFLADLWIPCAACEGQRYARPTLQVEFKGKSIADCLNLDVQQAMEHFSEIPKIASKLATLSGVGLDYLKLGQPSPTLSGGEAQRIKLAKELSRRSTGKTVYVLDEPTTGLHFHDIDLLLRVLQSLVDRGNTVIVVEHNLDLIQAADWIIDLGPEGGADGGTIVCQGTPEEVAKNENSHTGEALRKYFESHKAKPTKTKKSKRKKAEEPSVPSTELEDIRIVGAKQHNLQDVDIVIPRNEMTVFCGQSGSGKTSMAMDTLYAEGQRRFIESLSPYVRQFVGQMPKANVDRVEGLSPSVAIEQRNLSHTPRSTVGTVTEIYDYLRVLFARLGEMHCIQCDAPVSSQTSDQIVDRLLSYANTRGSERALILAPLSAAAFHSHEELYAGLQQQGFVRVRVNGKVYELVDAPPLNFRSKNEIQLVIDRVQWGKIDRKRMADSVDTALTMGNGLLQIAFVDESRSEVHWDVKTFSLQLACNACGLSFQPLTPHSFSFNSALGWCDGCQGIGSAVGIAHHAIYDTKLSLNEGGFYLWKQPSKSALSKAMLRVFCRETGIDADTAIGQLSAGHRSLLLKGLPNREMLVTQGDIAAAQGYTNKALLKSTVPYTTFSYRGANAAIEMAASHSFPYSSPNGLRSELAHLTEHGPCLDCNGSRVRSEAAHARLRNQTIGDLVQMPIGNLFQMLTRWKLTKKEQQVAGELLREIIHRLKFLNDVGLEYLSLDRGANTLSGGEAQRIRLASQLGAGLSGVLYVLDEPTIGLHPRDNHRLINAIKSLRDLGNTLVVVEHDRDVIASSDQVRDFGPGSGPLGGRVVAEGTPKQISKSKSSVTGPFLGGESGIPSRAEERIQFAESKSKSLPQTNDLTDFVTGEQEWLRVNGARENTLRNIDVAIPIGCLTAVTGPSGSGKSSLINRILYPAFARSLHYSGQPVGLHKSIKGLDFFRNVLRVDQSPLGLTPASNPATYTGVFDHIRNLYNSLPSAKERFLTVGHFSFNVPGGRCELCEGVGQQRIEMHFLPDVWIECEGCNGRRYISEVLEVKYKGVAIDELLKMSIQDVRDLMCDAPKVHKILDTLCRVGLGYVALGQSAPTLSGGEAQRVKLAAELCRQSRSSTLYLLDEPTTGLHFNDIIKLMEVLQSLVDEGHTVVVIEHNLDVIRCADWVIDLGPEAGIDGGDLVFAGPPKQLANYAATWKAGSISTNNTPMHRSYTGEALNGIKSKRSARRTRQ